MCKDLVNIPVASLKRIPTYLSVFKSLKEKGELYVSSNIIATLLNENASVVKKDLSYIISQVGKPKVGYDINSLIKDIEGFLGYHKLQDAVIVGVGQLGAALLNYNGFEQYGFRIIAGFDIDESKINATSSQKRVLPLEMIKEVVSLNKVKIGIITTPSNTAQQVANTLVKAGVRAIWNFTPSHLEVPKNVVVKNENLATSLAVLSKQLQETLKEN